MDEHAADDLERASKLAIAKLAVFRGVNEYLKATGEQPDEELTVRAVEKIPSHELAKLQDLKDKDAFDKQLKRLMAIALEHRTLR